MKYNFMITEYLRRSVRVEAESAEEAYQKIEDLLCEEKINLTVDDFADRDIQTVDEYEESIGNRSSHFTNDETYPIDDDFSEEEIVCLSLKSLYDFCRAKAKTTMCDAYSDYAECEHCIIRDNSAVDGGEYYALYSDRYGDLKLCCDGEQCKVLERTDEYVKLIDVENIDNDELDGIDTTFKLTLEEFDIATGKR